jgi:hypothetical protein
MKFKYAKIYLCYNNAIIMPVNAHYYCQPGDGFVCVLMKELSLYRLKMRGLSVN